MFDISNRFAVIAQENTQSISLLKLDAELGDWEILEPGRFSVTVVRC